MADLFDLQDELTQAIVTAVAPEISAYERSLARKKPTESLTAWELAQRAHAEYYRYTAEAVRETIELVTRAKAADLELVVAHTLLARARVSEAMAGWSADPEGSLRAVRAAAERAVEIDSRNDAAFGALGFALAFSDRFREAIEMLERAKALNPNSPITLLRVAFTRLNPPVRDAAQAMSEAREALRLSPTDSFAWTFHLGIGLALLLLVDHLAALESLDTARGYPNVDWKPAMLAALAAG